MKGKKNFKFKVVYTMVGDAEMAVPADFTQEQAEEYVRDHWAEVKLPKNGGYLGDSAEPDFEQSSFD